LGLIYDHRKDSFTLNQRNVVVFCPVDILVEVQLYVDRKRRRAEIDEFTGAPTAHAGFERGILAWALGGAAEIGDVPSTSTPPTSMPPTPTPATSMPGAD
jgi:hypothetical protein